MAERTFESQMARLEEIVRLLERGEAPLSESMKLFEEGTKLSASLGKLLDKAEQKVTVMQENMQGELVEQPFARVTTAFSRLQSTPRWQAASACVR